LGGWQVWLLALGGLVYVASASLYSFYGSVAFDFPSVLQLPDARTAAITHFIAGLSEEILFRGLVLYALIRVWENLTQGILGSVLLAAALFAFVVSTWWGALAVMGAAYGRQRSNISWSMRSWLCKA
jgi:membrane protease YdiL (CAAX protease family)